MPRVLSLLALVTIVSCLLPNAIAAGATPWKDLLEEADSLSKEQDYDSAMVVGAQALDLATENFGNEDSTVALIVWSLGNYHYLAGNYEQAYSLYQRAALMRQRVLGVDHPDVATSLKDLAITCKALDRFEEGESAAKRALAIWEYAYGPGDSTVIGGLVTLADIYEKEGRFKEAEPLYQRGLAICRERLSPDSYVTAYLMNNLGWLYMDMGRYAEAERLNREALEMRERIYGPVHPMVARSLDCLGSICWRQGRYSEAEAFFKRAQAIFERPPGHPNLAVVLYNLANLYGDQGKYAEAEALYREAMAIEEKTYGPASFEVALDMQLIAGLYDAQERYSEADSLYVSALQICEHEFGPDHIYTASLLQDRANSLQAQRRYDEAEPLYDKALIVFERDLGPEHPDVATTQINLANLFLAQAEYAKTESLYSRASDIREKAFGPNHPAMAEVYQSLSKYFRARGEGGKSLELSVRGFEILRKSFIDNSYDLSEKDALTFSLLMRNAASNHLSCYFDAKPADRGSVRSAWNVIVGCKGEVSDGIFDRQRALVAETDPATVALSDSLRSVRFEIAQLFIAGPGDDTSGAYLALLDSLGGVAGDLEARLVGRSASFRSWGERRQVGADRVASLLPPKTALIEYLTYDYYPVKPDTAVRHYLAAVIEKDAPSLVADLGDASRIDALVTDYRNHMLRVSAQEHMPLREDQSDYAEIAGRLYAAVIEPIERHIAGKEMLFVAPDGGLNLVSFSALIDDRGKYLVETVPVHYLSASRDLVRLDIRGEAGTGLLALGDPDYDAARGERLAAADISLVWHYAGAPQNVTRNVQSNCEGLRDVRGEPLPYTRQEILDVVRRWHADTGEPVVQLLGALATEDNFKAAASGRRAIHLATHGYFLEGRCQPRHARDGVNANTVFVGENPLLLSGLLLTGSNLRDRGADSLAVNDGILTAYEISALNLKGAETVILSACETGLGEVKGGEGVYGLRRAFQMAGARTVVSALWPVPDDVTAEMMASVYTQSDKSLAERLRAAQLAEINRLRAQGLSDHPYRWAGFIAMGDWR